MVDIRWVWLFLHHEDRDGDDPVVDRAWRFWADLTGGTISPRRGDHGQFATLVPATGDGWAKLQRTAQGQGIHVDLVVEDVDAAASQAVHLGGASITSYSHVRVMRSPGGFLFCFTDWASEGRPREQVRDSSALLLDQASLDIPPALLEAETAFWSALTGWEVLPCDEPELSALRRPDDIPVRFLLQRVDEGDGPVTGHADIACTGRARAVRDALAAGAEVVAEHPWWTVMRDPAGLVFCLTGREPATGLAPTRT